jgi:hypothetical protein
MLGQVTPLRAGQGCLTLLHLVPINPSACLQTKQLPGVTLSPPCRGT